jgi:hypothetical protein
MKDLALGNLVKSILQAEFGLENIYVGSPVESEAIRLPAILVDVTSTAVVGSELYRGTLSVATNMLCEPNSEEAHRSLSQRVDTLVRTIKGQSNIEVEILGVVATDVRQNPTDNYWSTTMQYIVGFA